MHECKGCGKIFKKEGSLNTHKRFCDQWQSLGLQTHKGQLSLEDRKKIPVSCPLCNKVFNNIYSMTAHKGHCSGKNNTAHLEFKRSWSKGLTRQTDERLRNAGDARAIPIQDILSGKYPRFSTNHLKQRLLRDGLVKNSCSLCGISEWMGKNIVCELDHINGNRHDHRLENLRMLCPNCHSQTKTYCGKNKGNYVNSSIQNKSVSSTYDSYENAPLTQLAETEVSNTSP